MVFVCWRDIINLMAHIPGFSARRVKNDGWIIAQIGLQFSFAHRFIFSMCGVKNPAFLTFQPHNGLKSINHGFFLSKMPTNVNFAGIFWWCTNYTAVSKHSPGKWTMYLNEKSKLLMLVHQRVYNLCMMQGKYSSSKMNVLQFLWESNLFRWMLTIWKSHTEGFFIHRLFLFLETNLT